MSALLAYVSAHPWCLHEPTLNAFRAILMRHVAGERVSAEDLAAVQAMRDTKHGAAMAIHKECAEQANGSSNVRYAVRGNIAIMPVTGMIARLSSQVNGQSQPKGTSLEGLNATLDAIAQDSRVSSVLMYIDSPGGYGDGLEAFSNRLASYSKPVYAYGESLVASAAYWLGSQAKEFKVALGTDVGSIGTYAVVDDYSKLYAMRGISTQVVKSAKHKGDFVEGVPVTQDMIDNLQRGITLHSERFIAAVARGRARAMTPAQVQEVATGQVWTDAEATAKGLADGVATFEQFVNELNQRHAPQSSAWATAATKPAKEAHMAAETKDGAGGAPTGGETINFTEEKAKLEAKAREDAKIAGVAGAKAERERIAAINQYATKMGVALDSDVVKKAIDDGTEPEKALAGMLDSKVVEPLGQMDSIEIGSSGQQRQIQDHTLAVVERAMNVDTALADQATGQNVARALGFNSVAEARSSLARVRAAGLVGMPLMDHAKKFTRNSDRMGREGLIQASFGQGTSQFPNLLSNISDKLVLAGQAGVAVVWRQICRKGSPTDFKTGKRIRTSEVGNFQDLDDAQGDTKATALSETAESVGLRTSAMRWKLTREAMYNDDLDDFASIPVKVGRAAGRKPDLILFARLAANSGAGPTLADGNPLFHSTRGNVLTSAALSFAKVQDAITAFMERTIANDRDEAVAIDVAPATLLVPSNLLPDAWKICTSPTDPTASQANPAIPNFVNQQGVRPISSAVLKSKVSTTRWWLFANINDYACFEARFLNGNESPTIAQMPAKSQTYVEYEAIFDCDVNAIDSIGGMTNAGT